ncbi:hypothetical protein J4429_03070 [Candidatus Pacearchaeota archaeon]|nr:hypothetical protein [Candidatus Pacearchaeota archaeon]
MNKKAADTTVIENTIFIVLNIVFFAIMLIFVYNSGSNILVKEQSYAKEIALIIDNCKPGMSVLLNINDLIETAKKNNFPVENIVKLDKKNNRVLVSLRQNSVFGFQYFSKDAEVKLNNNWLLIEVGKSSLLEKETSERK